MKSFHKADDGAAAVEFALVTPLLLLIILAIADLGWVFNQQLTLTAAAREGARIMAVHHDDPGASGRAEARVNELVNSEVTVSFTATCSPAILDDVATVTVSAPLDDLTGWLSSIASSTSLTGVGSMRCGG
ncbi:TadE/TadG family type IV pilus assembly protein [Agromyces indicus]|uniref:TadE/TadG family type IV pilus assembly protein n=1 Tax=Agromyces indicus TaxID=758919 RepID=A0ABU1FH05_9MICO|nr:TadE/TadG family type IV pilus assembly protein [Agromyces indicus]MDR5691037.1 TadE/TadG family type IV pilus assembly protein [Agromyces indicus]